MSYIADFSDIVLGHSHSDQPAEKTDVRNYDLTDHPKSKVPAEQKGLAEELKGMDIDFIITLSKSMDGEK